jgi:hypothetical protein
MSIEEIKFSGLSIEGHRNIGGGRLLTYFAIPIGKEAAAASDILSCLAEGFEVMLNNDLDEGNEGYTQLRMSPFGLEIMTGGHGWSSNWKHIEEAEASAVVKDLAHLNRGGHRKARASFESVVD